MHKFTFYILSFFLTLFTVSCSGFLDVNTDPNNPSIVPPELLLASALQQSNNMEQIGLSNGPGVLTQNALAANNSYHQLGSVWAGQWAKATDAPNTVSLFRLEETYAVNNMATDWGGYPFWEDTYKIILNYKNIEQIASKEGSTMYVGIAKIMQAWHFMRLVDLYNNIPFSDALKGTLNTTPKFENGETVYTQAINLITQGIQDIKSANEFSKKPGADDILFKGNVSLWAKFGNTIKLRSLLRQSQLNKQSYIDTELQKITDEGSGFLGIGESALINPGYITGTNYKANPYWEKFYRNAQGALTANYHTLRPTEVLINTYQQLNDPRMELIYLPVDNKYIGVPLGSVSKQFSMDKTSAFRGPNENGGKPAGILKSATQASVLLSATESLFLQAEAAHRGWITTQASNLYSQAITESFNYIGAKEVNLYLDQDLVNYNKAPNKLERIIQQKWLALNGLNGFELWCDYRRLGLPRLPQSIQSPNADLNYRPARLGYRISELSRNRIQVEAQGNIDPFVSKVFWHK